MSATQLIPHEQAVLLHRRGQFVIGRLSGSRPSIAVTAPDLVLLSRFLGGGVAAEAVADLTGGEGARYLPGPTGAEAIKQRIQQFQQAEVLVAAGESEPVAPGEGVVTLEDCGDTDPGDGQQLFRLCANFLLQPSAGGFAIYSAGSGHHVLDLELALLMLACADGRRASDVAAQCTRFARPDQVRRALTWLVRAGLVKEVEEKQSSSIRAENSSAGKATQSRAHGPTWRELQPDGRIPVYFMPHMENHYPLALGMIFSAIRAFRGGALLDRFQLIPITYLEPQAFFQGPYRKFGRGVWLFSNYMWSDELNLKVSDFVKQQDSGNITLHGGPSTPGYEQACRDFMNRHRSVDIAVHGEGEVSGPEVLACIEKQSDGRLTFTSELEQVEGITFRQAGSGELVRTEPRLRLRDPDIIPSPYAEGVFDSYEGRIEAAIVETNRGCPFKCTFCDWGSATNQKVTRFDMARIHGEIEWIGRNQVKVLWIADANFGMLPRDLEIARWIVDTRTRFGYPREVVVNYTKNANQRLAEIIKVFSEGGIISQGIISIQTTDEKTLEIIDRKNIKTEKYDELIEVFSSLGLPLSTDLMIGLPGITPEAFDRDLQRYIDVDVAVKAYPTQLLPNSPMAHPAYRQKYQIEVDENNYLVSCSSYSAEELQQMKLIYHVYTAADGYGALRYVMRYLQWEHGIRAIDFLHHLTDLVTAEPDRNPAITWVLGYFNVAKSMPGGWMAFYDQIAEFIGRHYGIERDAALDVVLKVNELAMPDEARSYPLDIELAYDFVSYFRDHNKLEAGKVVPLNRYGPGRITFSDPNRIVSIDVEHQQYDNHQYFWELHSPIARPNSIADYADKDQEVSATA